MAVKVITQRGYVYVDCRGDYHWDTFTLDRVTYDGKLGWKYVEVKYYKGRLFDCEFDINFE